jgi:hypothetical protein
MPLYYFDTRDDTGVVPDETGLEFDTLEQAKAEAARGLVDIARDRVPGPDRLVFVVEVLDENKHPCGAGESKLIRRSYWLDMDDRTLVMVMTQGSVPI